MAEKVNKLGEVVNCSTSESSPAVETFRTEAARLKAVLGYQLCRPSP